MGPVEQMVRANVSALPTTHPMVDALAEISYGLARSLDKGAGLAEAAVSRELRATLAELASHIDDGEGDDLAALLSAPMGNPKD